MFDKYKKYKYMPMVDSRVSMFMQGLSMKISGIPALNLPII